MDNEELVRLFVKALTSGGAQGPQLFSASPQAFSPRPTTSQAVDLLRFRSSFFESSSQAKSLLQDGRQGYRVRAEAQCEIILGPDPNDPAAKREVINMKTSEAQVHIADPVLTLDGVMRVDLEIISFTLEGVSTRLTDAEVPIRMHCGRFADKYMRRTFGRIEVPQGLEFSQAPVKVVHEVFVTIETPIGVLHNREPATMLGYVTKMPPTDEKYEQVGRVALYNEEGVMAASKVTQTSYIKGLVDNI